VRRFSQDKVCAPLPLKIFDSIYTLWGKWKGWRGPFSITRRSVKPFLRWRWPGGGCIGEAGRSGQIDAGGVERFFETAAKLAAHRMLLRR